MTTNRIAAIVGGAALFILGLIIGAAISGGPSVEDIDATVGDKSCRVTVEGIDRGRVALGYVCG